MGNEANLQELRTSLRGTLITPQDEGYDAARKVYNGMIDRRPRLIARCADVADVVTCIRFAREHGVTVSIRGGGHNAGGLGVWDDCLVVDLSQMRGVRVNPADRTARVEGGCVWGDVDHATHAFGLATPSGIISTTGVAGLCLGGGLGHLTRKYGLTIDNLLEADVVLADGQLVTASEEENEDLFWALRGGGGNFGVVTSFLFQLHPVQTIVGGPVFWELDQAENVMRWYRSFITEAPEDLNGFFAFLVVPPVPIFPEHLHNRTMCGIIWCYTGPQEGAEEAFQSVREMGELPALYGIHSMPYPALQSVFDALLPAGLQWYWRADFVQELPDEAIARHVKYGGQIPTLRSTMHLYPINGAAHNVGRNDTAFSYRDATWAQVIVGIDPDPKNKELITTWTKAYHDALHPYSMGGAYVNMMMDEGQERVKASYRDNYSRLAAIKRKYDPDNFFRINQNILPAEALVEEQIASLQSPTTKPSVS
jgi:FAD/FMN-containing dehydrogenase